MKVKQSVCTPGDYADLLPTAKRVVEGPSVRRSVPAGYDMKPGERALLVVNSFHDEAVVNSLVDAIRQVPATVDLISIDMGPDRPSRYTDELWAFIHNAPGIPEDNIVRKWVERIEWVETVAEEEGYDILIHSLGGRLPETGYRYEGIPWLTRGLFAAADFPFEISDLVNRKTWDLIWNTGRGGRVRLTDPEGTDVAFTLHDKYYDYSRYAETESHPRFQEEPCLGHLFGRQTPPLYEEEEKDASGVVAGTTNHMSRPFPHIKVHIEGGKAVDIEGGGEYGDEWRRLLDATKDIHYPEFPSPGLFWWWELAIGTNPKMRRVSEGLTFSGGGTVFERLRSGLVHMGIGTGPGPSEYWAAQRGVPYGHLHVHCMFPTYEITCRDGRKIKVIDNGHLTVLDDPEVVALASKYGDPKEVLKEEWIPPVPGISIPGDYWSDYAPEPAAWIESHRSDDSYAALPT